MKVDCIVPYFNQEEYLSETISSLRKQSQEVLGRIIIVDDGSDTPASEVLKNLEFSDSGITVLRTDENYGESAAVNLGWKNIKSNWVAIVSSDDPQPCSWLKEMSQFILKNPGFLFYYPNRIVIDSQGVILRKEQLREFREHDLLKSLVCVPSVGTLIDASKLPLNFKPRHEEIKYPSDLFQFCEMLKYGKGKLVPNVWAQWRNHNQSQSLKIDEKVKIEMLYKSALEWARLNPNLTSLNQVKVSILFQAWRNLRDISRFRRMLFVIKTGLIKETLSTESITSIYRVADTFVRGKVKRFNCKS